MDLPEVKVTPEGITYKGSEPLNFKLIHTALYLEPDIPKESVSGHAIILLQSYGIDPGDTLKLDAQGFSGITIEAAKGTSTRAQPQPLTYRYDERRLYIYLPPQIKGKVGDTFSLSIHYLAEPTRRLTEHKISSRDQLGLIFINPQGQDSLVPTEFWSQGETNWNSAWYPTIDAPNQKMTQEIYLTVDSSLRTLSNGRLVTQTSLAGGKRRDYWRMDKPLAPYLSMIAAGPWLRTRHYWQDSIPVEYYLEKEYAPYANLIFGKTPQMISFYSRELGYPYPWSTFKQVVVRDFTSGAMENTTCVVHFDLLQHDRRQHKDETYEDIISHELFHHWFGDLVTCESYSQIAMNESFATLGEFLWRGYKYGNEDLGEKREQSLQAYLRESISTKDRIITHYYNDPETLFDRHRYEKGGLALWMLRDYMGAELFRKALSRYLHERQFKTTELDYFRLVCEDVSGQDLNWFFDQWFYTPGHPELEIRQSWNEDTHELKLKVIQNQSSLFRLPLSVDIYLPGDVKLRKDIILSHARDTLTWKLDAEPLCVNFDARKVLLGQKREYKKVGQWYFQFLHGREYADKHEALLALNGHIQGDSLSAIVAAGIGDSLAAIRKETMDLNFGQKGSPFAAFKNQIHTIARNDRAAKVRRSALEVLRKEEALGAKNIYTEALQDSSYLVAGTALDILNRLSPATDSTWLIHQAHTLAAYRHSSDLMMEVATVYSAYGTEAERPFFRNTGWYIRPQYLSSFLNLYKDYLHRYPADELPAEMPYILRLSDRAKSNWSRLSFRSFLNDLASDVESGKFKKGRLSLDERSSLAQSIRERAEKVDIHTP